MIFFHHEAFADMLFAPMRLPMSLFLLILRCFHCHAISCWRAISLAFYAADTAGQAIDMPERHARLQRTFSQFSLIR